MHRDITSCPICGDPMHRNNGIMKCQAPHCGHTEPATSIHSDEKIKRLERRVSDIERVLKIDSIARNKGRTSRRFK